MKHWSSLPDLSASAQPSPPPGLQRSLSVQSLDDALDQQARNALSFRLGAKLGSGMSCATYECQIDAKGGISQLVLFRSPISKKEEWSGLDHVAVLDALELPSDYSGQLEISRLKKAMDFCVKGSFYDFFHGASTKDLCKDIPYLLAESNIYGAVKGKIGAFIRKAEGYVPMHDLCKSAFTGNENHSAIVKNIVSLMQDFSSSWRAMHLSTVAHTDPLGPNFGCTGFVSLDQTSPRPRLAIIDMGSFQRCNDDSWRRYFANAVKRTFIANFSALSKYEMDTPKIRKLGSFYRDTVECLYDVCKDCADVTPSQFLEKFDAFIRNFQSDFDKLNQDLT